MKTSESLVVVMVSVFFIAGLGYPAWAQPIRPPAEKKTQEPLSSEEKQPAAREPLEKPDRPAMQCQDLSITTPLQLSPAKANTPYSEQIQASGGREPISFSPFGPLPPGLNLSSKGVLSGTPTTPGNYKFFVKATDSCQPAQTFQRRFALSVAVDLRGQRPPMAAADPVIEAFFAIPMGEPLKQDTRLYLNGRFFGTRPGKILMYGDFPNSPVALVDVNWESDKQVNGVVPASANGAPNQTVTIKVKSADDRLSNPMTMNFVGREQKWVRRDDVLVLHCGDDGNCNCCNHILTTDAYSGDAKGYCEGASSNVAIVGLHLNVAGAIGDDEGTDRYSVHLANGWVFKDVEVDPRRSSSDEHIGGPVPAFPVGQSDWTPEFNWLVTPGDYINYRVGILVEGPLGTDYK